MPNDDDGSAELFVGADGLPQLFFVDTCQAKTALQAQIVKHGGAVVPIIDEHCTPLFDDNALLDGKVRSLPRPFYRAKYIDDCIAASRLLDLQAYLLSSRTVHLPASQARLQSPPELISPSVSSQSKGLALAQARKRGRAEQTRPDDCEEKKAAGRLLAEDAGDAAAVVRQLAARTQLPEPVVFHALIVCSGDAQLALRYLNCPYALPADALSQLLGFAVWTPGEDKALQSDEEAVIVRIIKRRGKQNVSDRVDFLDPLSF